MSKSGEPIQEFYRRAENGLPLVCNYGGLSRRLAHWLEMKHRLATYGHSYAYGNHRQLVKAKYFASGEILRFYIRTDEQMTREQYLHP